MKTQDLTGPALDWAVAKCRGFEGIDEDQWLLRDGIADMPLSAYNPSTNWAQGGPIIEQEKLDVMWCGDRWCAYAMTSDKETQLVDEGPTPLIAAMRCFVASRLGDKVDIPEEMK